MTTPAAAGHELDGAGFWAKVRRLLGKLPFLRDALALYYCAVDPATPAWVKVAAFSALFYFMSPIDAVPDCIPVVGYTDDAAVIAATVAAVRAFVTEEHYRKADEWLGG